MPQKRYQENGGSAANNYRREMGFPVDAFTASEKVADLRRRCGRGLKGVELGMFDDAAMEACGEKSKENGFVYLMDGQNSDGNCKGIKNKQSKLCCRGHWKPSEDTKLRELVAIYGPRNWNLVAEKLEGRRSGKSCRLRWHNQLDPKINKGAFSEEEEWRLMSAQTQYGNKWALISRLFPGRTDNAVKNHWHVVMAARRHKERSKPCMKLGKQSSQSINYYRRRRFNTDENSATNSGWERRWRMKREILLQDSITNNNLSTSEISFADQPSLAGQSHCDQNSATIPTFIDFLGVGAP